MLAILFYTQIKLKLECTSCGSWTLNQMHPEANLGVGVFWVRESWCQGSTSAAASRTSAAVSRTSLDLSDKVRIIKTDKDYILVELENSDEELVAGGRRVWVKRDTFFRVECVL